MKLVNICNNCQLVTTGENNIVFSYGTPVFVMSQGHHHRRLWNGWSATTQKHINKCLDYMGLSHINKKVWDSMPVETLEG